VYRYIYIRRLAFLHYKDLIYFYLHHFAWCAIYIYIKSAYAFVMKGKTMQRFENIIGAVYEVVFYVFLSCAFAFCIYNMVGGFVS